MFSFLRLTSILLCFTNIDTTLIIPRSRLSGLLLLYSFYKFVNAFPFFAPGRSHVAMYQAVRRQVRLDLAFPYFSALSVQSIIGATAKIGALGYPAFLAACVTFFTVFFTIAFASTRCFGAGPGAI
jgi:hypothetical protein